jgi:hypothetical protein
MKKSLKSVLIWIQLWCSGCSMKTRCKRVRNGESFFGCKEFIASLRIVRRLAILK